MFDRGDAGVGRAFFPLLCESARWHAAQKSGSSLVSQVASPRTVGGSGRIRLWLAYPTGTWSRGVTDVALYLTGPQIPVGPHAGRVHCAKYFSQRVETHIGRSDGGIEEVFGACAAQWVCTSNAEFSACARPSCGRSIKPFLVCKMLRVPRLLL
jgi:hypothetical protein